MTAHGATTPRILLVDDDPDILDSLKTVLELSLDGVEVDAAPSGLEALRILQDHGVQLIITDYRMPGMTGAEFLARAEPLCPGVPHLLISAFTDHVLQAARESHARIDRIMPKPMDMDELITTAKQMLGSAAT